MSKKVISVGGSLIVPNKVDVGYLTQLRQLINSYTNRYQFYLIAGGGKTARDYQDAAKQLGLESKRELDDLGIRAALLNSQLLYSIFFKERPVIIADLNAFNQSQNKIVINGFYQHGASSDRIAVEVAARVGANQVINLSNIDMLYTKNPKETGAQPIESATWEEVFAITGDEWTPGMNTPFDPIAGRLAQRHGMAVVIANGRDLKNLERIIAEEKFVGTTIKSA